MAYTKFRNGLDITTTSAIDKRIYLTKAEMLTAEDKFNLPDTYLAVCPDDGKLYLYNVNNTTSAETGKFKPIEATTNFEVPSNEESKVNFNEAVVESAAFAETKANVEKIKADYLTSIDKAALQGSINKKVTAEAGKRLMTDAEGTKLEGIDTGAQVNIIEKIKLSGEDIPIEDKTANIKVDAKTIGLESTNVAYTDKDNTFTEPQTFDYTETTDSSIRHEYAEIGAANAHYYYTEKNADGTSESGEAFISSLVGRISVNRSTNDDSGTSKRSLTLDVNKNWIARNELTRERIDGNLGTPVQTYYAYKFPKTYPNKEVTLATIEDLTAQFGALNIKNGSGVNSIEQTPDGEAFNGLQKGVTENSTTVEYSTDAAGQNSTILGGKNRAEAKRSAAIGGYNVAAGASSLATGEQTITEGRCSFTAGQRTRAKGGSSLASGGYSLALGDFSMTQGYQTEASGRSAMATGAGTSAEGDAALSSGTGTKAIGDASVAFGNDTQSKGNYSAAFGSSTQANGVNSVAMGDRSIANAASSKVEGINNIANNSAYVAPTPGGGGGSVEPVPPSTFDVEEHYGEGSHVEGAYNSGYGFASHAEGLKVSARGHYSHAEGTSTISSGESSHAEGGNTKATGKWSHAEGDSSIASNNGSHAEGKSQATGGYSHSEGSGTKAIGQGSHAEGRNTQAEADFSHAEGISSLSSGQGSHAEGNSTASNTYAHSEGESTTASGRNSHTQGKWTKAVGDNSTAVGISTTATGNNSFAGGNGSEAAKNGSFVHGFGLKSNQENQAVFGVYNAPYNATLLVVGNGTQDNYRTNAFEVYQDGRAKVQTAPKEDNDVVRKLELDTKYDKTGGTIGGDVIITGDLTVNGTQHINNTENLNVENAMIYSNAAGATLATNGGIGIKKDAADIYGIVYDPTSDSVKLGLGKSDANGTFTFNANEGQPVAIRDDSSKFTNNNLVRWDGTNHKLVDSGKNVESFVNKLAASLRNQAYVRNANGEDTGLAYTYTDEGGTLAVRNASGQLQVSDPLQDKDAANKKFVEDNLNSILYPVQKDTQYSTSLLTAKNIGKYYTFTTSVLTTSDYWVDPDNITVNAGTVVKILPIEDSHGAGIKPFFKIVGIDNRELYLTNGQGKCSIVKRAYGSDTTPKAIGYYSNVFSVDTDSQFGGQATSKYSTLFGVNVRADSNAEGSIVGGRYCIIDSPYTFAYGRSITTQASQETITKVVLGYNNKFNTKAILEIGNGTDSINSNAFEVLKDGRAKVQSAPAENDDVLRLNELSVLTQEQVNSLF